MATATNRVSAPATSANKSNVVARVLPTTTATLRLIPEDETFSPTMTPVQGEPGLVDARYAVRPDEKSEDRYEVTTRFDFRGCSPVEVQLMAAKHAVIVSQRNFRIAAKTDKNAALRPDQWRNVNVKVDIIDAARATADPMAKAKSAVSKLSSDERKALFAQLANDPDVQAMLKKLDDDK